MNMTARLEKNVSHSLILLQEIESTEAIRDTYLQIVHLLRMLISLRRMRVFKMSINFLKGIQLIFNSVYFSSHVFLL